MKSFLYLILTIGIILFDQITKFVASQNSSIKINFGISFGILSQKSALFISLLAYFILLLIFFLSIREKISKYKALAFIMFLAGGLSNLIDRFSIKGGVVDWISLFGFFTFNFSDTVILLGMLLLLYEALFPNRFRRP